MNLVMRICDAMQCTVLVAAVVHLGRSAGSIGGILLLSTLVPGIPFVMAIRCGDARSLTSKQDVIFRRVKHSGEATEWDRRVELTLVAQLVKQPIVPEILPE